MVTSVPAPLENRVIVVTGGRHGIGAGIVSIAQAQGAQVVSFDIDPSPGEHADSVVSDLLPVKYLEVDVTSEQQIAAAVQDVVGTYDHLHGWVNNAGRNSFGEATTMAESEWDQFMDLDLKAAWLCAKVALPHLIESSPAAIVNISSLHSLMTAKHFFPYAAAKTGIVGLTKSLALDFGLEGVRVNAVSPGYVDTKLAKDYFNERPGELERVLGVHPMGRIGQPEDIAEVVCFLLSEKSRFVTGANWFVDGGLGSRFA